MSVYDHKYENLKYRSHLDKDWTIDQVVSDSWVAKYDFKRLLKLAEAIKAKQGFEL